MKKLTKNWLTSDPIDSEYKKYVLLAYLQGVRKQFDEKELYPSMAELVFHYENLLYLKENKTLLYENFPKELSKLDFENLALVYKDIIRDDALMAEIEDLVSFSVPKFKAFLTEGKNLYESAEEQLAISPVGLSPLYTDEGYMFIREFEKKFIAVYEYRIGIFHRADEKYRGIYTDFVADFKKNIGVTYESIKKQLARKKKFKPNPAVYLVEAKAPLPFSETVFPIAKRMLVKYISPSTDIAG